MLAPEVKSDSEHPEHRGRILQPEELLHRIQDDAMRKEMKTQPHRLPGRYRIDDRIHVAETPTGDFAWCPAKKDELLANYRLVMPERNRWQLQDLRSKGVDFDRLFIVHELGERGYKQGVEEAQHIPIELIEPISTTEHIRQEADDMWNRLSSWTKSQLAHLAQAIGRSTPRVLQAVGLVLAALVAIAVVVAIVYVILTILATLLLGAIVLAGLVAGASGVDPIVIGAIDHDDGSSTLYYITHYRYPVRKAPHRLTKGDHV